MNLKTNNTMSRKKSGMAMMAIAAAASAAMAGPLNPPPGPITSTMKTLSEVEPRIAINATNTPGTSTAVYMITQPGSYYLTANVMGASGKSGIFIGAANVTIDLNGFTLQGVAGSVVGINSSSSGIAIKNGTISGWGSVGVGIGFYGRVSDVTSAFNGGAGIVLGNGGIIDSSVAASNGGDGIRVGSNALVRDCTASLNAQAGIVVAGSSRVESSVSSANTGVGIAIGNNGVATGCTSDDNTSSGFTASDQSSIRDCSASGNSGAGIEVSFGVLVSRCSSFTNVGAGISAGSGCRIEENMCRYNGSGAGLAAGILIEANTSRTVVMNNTVSGNDYGIRVDSPNHMIMGNTATNNSVHFEIVAGNRVSTILTLPTSGAISGSTGGTTITSPDANYVY